MVVFIVAARGGIGNDVSGSEQSFSESVGLGVLTKDADCGVSVGHSCLSPAIDVMWRGCSAASIKPRLSLLGLSAFESRAIGRDGNGLSIASELSVAGELARIA